MYPNSHWSSYQQYNVMQGALSTSRAAVPTLDQASLTAAAGLTHGLQHHASLPQHVLGSIPGVSIPRDLQSSAAMSQLLGTMSPHMGTFSTQALQKAGISLAQNQLTYENMATEQQVPVTSAHSSVTGFSQEKSALESKDSPHSYSSSAGSQNLTQESGAKSWMLYDLGSQNSVYLPQLSSSAYAAALAGMDLSNTESLSTESLRLSQPPPAHSSVSRHSAIQRNPFPSDGIMSETLLQSGKSVASASLSKPSQAQVSSVYAAVDDPRQQSVSSRTQSQTPQPQVESYVVQAQDLKDASRGSQQSQNHYYYVVDTYASSASSNTVSVAGSQLGVAGVNYDPVSPAAPLAESQPGETAFPSTVSLSDLNDIRSGCPDPHASYKSSGRNIHSRNANVTPAEPAQVSQPHHSLLIDQLSRGREGSKSQMQQISPHQQHSPISGENPQVSMASLGSPENSLLPSSSVKPVAMPVQAIADSSTGAKPKRPRKPRKPKADVQNANQSSGQSGLASSLQPAFMSSTQGFNRGSSSYQNESSSVQQYQQQQNSQNQMQQQQFVNASHSSQNVMGVRGGNLNSDGNYQVMSSVGNNQVSPISEQSPRSHQQTAETANLIPISNTRLPSSSMKGNKSNETAASGGTYQEQQSLLAQNGQYDLQVYSNQPYMEQLVSSQSVRLIPGNLYSESMHVAAGMTVYPYTFQTTEGSTIDEAAFSNLLMDSGANKTEQQGNNTVVERVVPLEPPPQAAAPPATPAVPPAPPSPPAKPSATCTRPVEEDDELCNFAQPPPELSDKLVIKAPKCEPPHSLQHNASAVPSQKPEMKISPTGPKKTGSAFQDTFLSFLMGHKQETLSSVTTATIGEKPQLPKYIPEPRRPPRPPPTPTPPPPPPPPPPPVPTSEKAPVPNAVSFSDDEDDTKVTVALKKAISTLDSDSNDSEVQEVPGKYCVQSTKDLTMKITLQNTITKQNRTRGRPPKVKAAPVPVGRGIGEGTKSKTTREPTPPPPRESIGRRAKDAAKEKSKKKKKYHESDSSGVEELGEEIKPKYRKDGSGSEYDSDRDPVWTPSEENEAKRPVGFNFDVVALGESKTRRKSKSKKGHKRQKLSEEFSEVASAPAAKVGRVDGSLPHKSSAGGRTVHTLSAEDQANNIVDENFQVGQFVLEKKDLHNYESYPIWRLESGRMLRKFELYMNSGRVCHKAVSTYSSWVPSMEAAYVPIQVVMINNKPHAEVVEVLEQYRPTPPNDSSLEDQFENDPLVDSFNVYLQTLLSQSLESSFLEAIRKSKEMFYLDPVEKIDKKIEAKLEEIDRLVQWKPNFREAMRAMPNMREMDRPNLKQSCQACERSSPPTIKSVLFHGPSYDHFLLTDLPKSDNSQEFLVGKFAAPYVTQYHSLHHFKHHLLKRCKTKVYMVREGQQSIDRDSVNESILDRCLQDRTWVLKIFQDFKQLLGELK